MMGHVHMVHMVQVGYMLPPHQGRVVWDVWVVVVYAPIPLFGGCVVIVTTPPIRGGTPVTPPFLGGTVVGMAPKYPDLLYVLTVSVVTVKRCRKCGPDDRNNCTAAAKRAVQDIRHPPNQWNYRHNSLCGLYLE